MKSKPRILVTGATGYIGGRLVPHLLRAGYQVRVLVRDKSRLIGRDWEPSVEVYEGDVLQPETIKPAMQEISVAYYLIHSMNSSAKFDERDKNLAENFGKQAREAGVARLIYLGGLGDPEADLSQHLRSRHETGEVLRESGVPITEFRAAVIVGSGSISFEMIRYLTERVPLMICPQWVFTRIQPIAIDDILDYLSSALQIPESTGKIIEIGGEDVLTYGEMMTGYAEVRGLKRYLIPVPVLTPRLSSYWVHWVTPVPASIAKPLIDGLKNEVIVTDPSAREIFPNIQPVDYQTAVSRALSKLENRVIESTWADSVFTTSGDNPPVTLKTHEGMILERRQVNTKTTAKQLYNVFSRLGGEVGWIYLDFFWELRGLIDRLVGGVGMRRGRRHPTDIRIGDVVDFWRVEQVIPGKTIRLRAEMKVPGKAWLEFTADNSNEGHSRLIQTAYFAPKGLSGILYWYLLYPIHSIIFSGLAHSIVRLAEANNSN